MNTNTIVPENGSNEPVAAPKKGQAGEEGAS